MRKVYDVIYIGAGPATIFSVLSNPIPNSLIIEKGSSIHYRKREAITEGFAGSGCWSDSKLVANPSVGGNILKVANDIDFSYYADQVLTWYNKFYKGDNFKWMLPDSYEFPSDKLKLLKSKVCHIGTDNSKDIFTKIEDYITSKVCNILFDTLVDFIEKDGDEWLVYCNSKVYCAKNVVIATGTRDVLLQRLIDKYNFKTGKNNIQMGVRVEAEAEPFKDLIDKFYDFKLVMDLPHGRIRSFCVNAGAAYVAVERDKNYISANGHAYKNKLNNGLVNFGVMGELDLNYSKDHQMMIIRDINSASDKLLVQNIDDYLNNRASKRLDIETTVDYRDYRKDDFNLYYLPENLHKGLFDYFTELKKHINFKGHFFAPEIKLVSPKVKLDSKFRADANLYVIGDVAISRGIVQAGISGIIAGEEIRKNI